MIFTVSNVNITTRVKAKIRAGIALMKDKIGIAINHYSLRKEKDKNQKIEFAEPNFFLCVEGELK